MSKPKEDECLPCINYKHTIEQSRAMADERWQRLADASERELAAHVKRCHND